MSDETDRRRLALRLGRVLATTEGRSALTSLHTSGSEILIALGGDTIGSVMAQATKHVPPVVVAVWLPGRSGCTGDFGFIRIEPGVLADGRQEGFGAGGTIGMLWDLMGHEERHQLTFRLTDWQAYSARGLASGDLVSS